jgi:uncharacterized membrane protein
MIVHFPIVLALLALAFDLWWLIFRRGAETPLIRLRTGTVIMTLGALSAIVAATFGDMAYDIAISKGVAESMLETHQGLGVTTMIVFIVAALLRLFLWWRQMDQKPAGIALAILASTVVVVLVIVTAYFGGVLVYDHGVNVGPMS